jgi:hypothetical protein
VLVVVAGSVAQPEVLLRGRVELGDPSGRVRRNVYQAARGLEPSAAAGVVEAAERIAAEQAARAIERTVQEAREVGVLVGSCAVVVGRLPGGARLESILASHALAHAAEGRLYQRALEQGAESRGLHAVAILKRSIWDEADSAFGLAGQELHRRIDQMRREIGPPWAEDQKLAALAAWIALARFS